MRVPEGSRQRVQKLLASGVLLWMLCVNVIVFHDGVRLFSCFTLDGSCGASALASYVAVVAYLLARSVLL